MLDAIMQGAEIHQLEELKKKLAEGRKLRVKYGIDPTAVHIHLGHLVGLLKLKQFQDAGHQAVLVVGNFTAMVGDPTGRDETRKRLSRGEVAKNADQYLNQIKKVLDMEKTEVRFNDSWFGQFLFDSVIPLMSQHTIQQILHRDDFAKRMEKDQPIYMHECLYPLLQAYDSLEVKADVEIGGNDQLFNFMLARDMQKKYERETQVCITVPILRGLDGVRRMGKSLNNYIGLDESPNEIFAKTMSIPDELMEEWWKLLPVDKTQWETILPKPSDNPMRAKKLLAARLVWFLHGAEAAERAEKAWHDKFSLKKDPEDISVKTFEYLKLWIVEVLVGSGLAKSKNAAKRLIEGGGVTFGQNREKVTDTSMILDISNPDGVVVRVGSRNFVKVYGANFVK
jgi:tyrosyl-tRNA synthetase